ncbi:MAG: exosortase system-associated protein, TIGR04073 family [Candidatus Omnitrophica bacterium]|nr:exosortase system-associated protein, TIGR04073 family [Candidatus Omnitrophota bacterium]
MKKIVTAVIIVCMVFCLAQAGYAEDSAKQDSLKKLTRGAINVLTGWVELPKTMNEVSVDQNLLTGLTVGFGKGLGMLVMRTAAGLYEVATFPFPFPEDYAPVIEPESVFTKEE